MAVASDLLQRVPELILKTHACLVAREKIERLTTSDFMMVPASYVGTMVPKCGAIWQAGLWHQKSMRRQPERLLHQMSMSRGLESDRFTVSGQA